MGILDTLFSILVFTPMGGILIFAGIVVLFMREYILDK